MQALEAAGCHLAPSVQDRAEFGKLRFPGETCFGVADRSGLRIHPIFSGDGTDARKRCGGQNPPTTFDDCVAVLGDSVKNG